MSWNLIGHEIIKQDNTKTTYYAFSAELLLQNKQPKIWEIAFINAIDVSQI